MQCLSPKPKEYYTFNNKLRKYNLVPRVSLLPVPKSERERETLENAGHVSPGIKNSQEGTLFMEVLLPQIFVNIKTRLPSVVEIRHVL